MSVRETLRDRTQAAHSRLDALWEVHRLRERAAYTRFLQATAAALVPLETRLVDRGVASLLPDWDARARAASVEADLLGLGASAVACAAPMLESEAELFGALYVLEGSRLGGAMIARAVAQSEDEAVLANRRYLGHGQAGRLWQSFLERLERLAPDEADLGRICAGARETFALFEGAARAQNSGAEGSDGDA